MGVHAALRRICAPGGSGHLETAASFLWLGDLTLPDPLHVLPLVLGCTSLLTIEVRSVFGSTHRRRHMHAYIHAYMHLLTPPAV